MDDDVLCMSKANIIIDTSRKLMHKNKYSQTLALIDYGEYVNDSS